MFSVAVIYDCCFSVCRRSVCMCACVYACLFGVRNIQVYMYIACELVEPVDVYTCKCVCVCVCEFVSIVAVV